VPVKVLALVVRAELLLELLLELGLGLGLGLGMMLVLVELELVLGLLMVQKRCVVVPSSQGAMVSDSTCGAEAQLIRTYMTREPRLGCTPYWAGQKLKERGSKG